MFELPIHGDTLTYAWDFGDSSAGIGATPSYTYTKTGPYTVSLVVNDGTMDSAASTSTVDVTVARCNDMKRLTRYQLSVVLAACLGTTLAVSTAQAGQIGADLRQAMQTAGDVDFIVQFRDQVDLSSFPGQGNGKGMQRSALLWALRDQAEASQSDAVKLLRANGAKRLIQLWSINALAVTASPAAIQQLAALPGVDSVKLDSSLTEPTPQPVAAATSEWNLDSIRAPEMWSAGYDGTGTVVASMDSGVDNLHPDLAASWRGGATGWFDPNGEHAMPYDKTGHGTQSTSLMVGGDAGGTNIGVAPGAQWIAVKIFNDAGLASVSAIHQGFQWLLDPDGNPNTNDSVADVVNNSWGYPDLVNQCYAEFNTDIAVLKTSGIAVVFSAGNQGSLGSVSPADNPESFAVGSVDASLNVASTSSRGPSACDGSFFPEVVAPGVSVRAADLTFGGVTPDSYATVSGTSFAAPHVAGTMAILRQANPDASVAKLEQALTSSALDLGTSGADNESGYGLIDAVAANDFLVNNPDPICTDADGDGYFAEAGCGTELDCNESDPNINPGACDIKRDGIDQDCDGIDRTKGKSCPVNNDVLLSKFASPGTYGRVGQVISYTYDVSNPGSSMLAGPVTVADDQETVTCPALSTIGNNDDNLDPGESLQCTASHTIVQADIAAGSLVNIATATVAAIDSNQDTETVIAVLADLAITKTDNLDSVAPSGSTRYTIVASNNGPDDVLDAAVMDIFPAGLTCTYTSTADDGVSGNTTSGAGNINDTLILVAGTSATYTATCQVAADASGALSNTATISSSVVDPVAGNDSATDITNVVDCAYSVNQPAGGETWRRGETQSVIWNGSGNGCAATVDIELFKAGVFNRSITTATSSTTYAWNIPFEQVTGNDFKVRITDSNASDIHGESAADFTIDVTLCNVTSASGVTESSNGTYEACEILVVGPNFIANDGASVFLSSGLEIWFMPEFLIQQGATLNAGVCGQSLCQISATPMPQGCHSCVVQICDIDSHCCDTAFDQSCLDKVNTICNLACE